MSLVTRLGILVALSPVFSAFPYSVSSPRVELKRAPDGGIQPEVAVGSDGTVHLIYFKGDPSEGDLFYATSRDGLNFSDPIRVNSVSGTAVAIGNIRGARIALGRNGNVYVVWNTSAKLGNPALGHSPMLFSRLNGGRTRVRAGAESYPYGVWNRRRRWNRSRSGRPGIRVLACAHSRQARRRVSASVGDALRKRWQIF